MRKVFAYVMALMVGLALAQMAGCKKAADKGGDAGTKDKGGDAGTKDKGGAAGTKDKGGPPAGQADKLVGVWKGKPTPKDPAKKGGPEMDMPITIEFKKGGAMTMGVAMFTMNGTWEFLSAEGNKFKIKATMEPPDLGPMMKDKGKPEKPETEEFDIVFLTDDQITMATKKDPSDIVTLDRQK